MTELIFSMIGFALVTSISPGGVTMMASLNGRRYGMIKSVPFSLGATIAFSVILATAGLGTQYVSNQVNALEIPIAIIGSIYLLYLVYALGLQNEHKADHNTVERTLRATDGAFLQFLNPKAWIVALSGCSIFIAVNEESFWNLALLISIFIPICFISIIIWARFGVILRNSMLFPKIISIVLLMIVFVNIVSLLT